jgi:hypothetical protein
VTNSASNAAAIQWFNYSNLQYGVDNTASYVTLTVVLQLLKRYALQSDWRLLFGSSIFGMQIFYGCFLLVVWLCWARNGWFYVFLNIDNQVAYDVTFFLSVIMVPELVEPGLEGVTRVAGVFTSSRSRRRRSRYGAFTTLTNAAQNVAGAISVQLLGIWNARAGVPFFFLSSGRRRATPTDTGAFLFFLSSGRRRATPTDTGAFLFVIFVRTPTRDADRQVSNAALHRDDAASRWAVTKLQLTCCAVGLAALLFTPLLPSQKADCARLRDAPSSSGMAHVVLVLIVLGMIYGLAMAILPVIPATACLELVGGSGCSGPDDDTGGHSLADDDDGGVSSFCGR